MEHTCNVIRRQIQDEIKDLTLYFVVHDDQSRSRTLAMEEQHILDHPAGEAALPVFKKYQQGNKTRFLGLTEGAQKKKLSLNNKQSFFLGMYFVNASEFETMEEAREHIYHLAWHAIELLEHYMAEDKKYRLSGDVIFPQNTPISLSKSNMAADVFAAVTLELQGNSGAIADIAYRRATATLSAIPDYKAEQYPYIIALETTQQVFDELKQNFNAKIRISGHAIHVAKEVNETYSDQPIKQWWHFCTRAQEMAWMRSNPDDILTAALYGSEDPYTRSIAYLIAESLSIEPKTLSTAIPYNPFADQQANERLHDKTCEEALQAVLSQAIPANNYKAFVQEAHMQNQKLAQGYPIGWCAHAMLKAGAAYKNADPESSEIADMIAKIFQDARTNIPWKVIEKANRVIMKKRRGEHEINAKELEKMSQKMPELSLFAHTFKTATKFFKKIENLNILKPEGINAADFILPGDLERDEIARDENTLINPDHLQKAEDA